MRKMRLYLKSVVIPVLPKHSTRIVPERSLPLILFFSLYLSVTRGAHPETAGPQGTVPEWMRMNIRSACPVRH